MTYEEASRRKAAELRGRAGVRILALETSCDETAAAVIEDGRKILSNVVFSQIDLHELYGGVVLTYGTLVVEKAPPLVDTPQLPLMFWKSNVNG